MLSPGPRTLTYGSPVNWAAPRNEGLVSWWQVLPLTSGGSTWHDLTGRFDATLTGGASSATVGWNSTTRTGGQGELRVASTSYASVPLFPAIDGLVTFTMSVWARQTTLDVIGGLLHKYLSLGVQTGLYTYNDGLLYFEINSSGVSGFLSLDYSTVISARTWFHVVAVYNGAGATNAAKAQLYINGRVPAGVTSGGTIATNTGALGPQPFYLGRYAASPITSWNGALDDIRFYDRALTADEATALYTASRQGYPQELTWRRWPFAAVEAPPPAGSVRSRMTLVSQALGRAATT
jgi:Concanavalin A-like lectin/glucanases superfamily